MAKCYAQFTHPSLAVAYPDDYETFDSLEECKGAFERFMSAQARFVDETECTGLVWIGEPEEAFPCDCYPDRELTVGKRGGINLTIC